MNCWAMATVWSVLPPSTTINSSPGAKVTPLRVAGRWSCSLRAGTITEMRGEGRRRDHGASAGHCVLYPEAATTQDLYDAENAQRSDIEATACVHDGG